MPNNNNSEDTKKSLSGHGDIHIESVRKMPSAEKLHVWQKNCNQQEKCNPLQMVWNGKLFGFLHYNCTFPIFEVSYILQLDIFASMFNFVQVIAAVDISKDEWITTNYVHLHLPNSLRREMLRDNWYFDCNCQRCSDSTELGTFLDAIKCHECHKGSLLPEKPLQVVY